MQEEHMKQRSTEGHHLFLRCSLLAVLVVAAAGCGGGGGGGSSADAYPPSDFTLSTPENNATGITLTPTLAWTDAFRESGFTAQISATSTFDSLVYENTALAADATSITVPAGTLSAGTQYFWRVIAVNAAGRTTATNAPFSFTTLGSGSLVWTQAVNPSNIEDEAYAVAVDASGLYVAGFDSDTTQGDDQWRIEKRSLSDGTLDSAFGTDGVIMSNPAGTTINSFDDANAIAIDSGSMFVAGYDAVPGEADEEWRIEKRRLSDGQLDAAFDGDGIVTSNPGTDQDNANAIAIDGTSLYIVGFDTTATRGKEWWIEKRSLATGALDTNFGSGGVVTADPSAGDDTVKAVVIDSTAMYAVGYDSAAGVTRWRIEKRNLSDGQLVAAFGSNGVVSDDPSIGEDRALAAARDATYLYIAGYDSNGAAGAKRWRIVRYRLSDGTADSAYGSGSGQVTSDPSAGDDIPSSIVVDSGFLYVGGSDSASTDLQWRLEKRNLHDGSLATAFGTGGIVTMDYDANRDDDIWAITTDADYLYIVGYDTSPAALDRQWRIEKRVK